MYEALVSFATKIISMFKGQVAEIDDPEIVEDLLAANYIEAYSPQSSDFDVIFKLEIISDDESVRVDRYEVIGSTFEEIYKKVKNSEVVKAFFIQKDSFTFAGSNETTRYDCGFVNYLSADFSFSGTGTPFEGIAFYGVDFLFIWNDEGITIAS